MLLGRNSYERCSSVTDGHLGKLLLMALHDFSGYLIREANGAATSPDGPCNLYAIRLHLPMIKSFQNKELKNLWEGKRSKIDARLQKRALRRLDALHAASVAEDVNLPGVNFHGLLGFNPKRYTIHVNGPWSITFEFDAGDAYCVDFEQYH